MLTDSEMETAIVEHTSSRPSRRRRFGFVVLGLGFGALLAYVLTGKSHRVQREFDVADNPVDDRGTGQRQASEILRNLRDRAFESSDERLALALGRPVEEVEAWSSGHQVIDDDVIMKARGIAMNRGIRVE